MIIVDPRPSGEYSPADEDYLPYVPQELLRRHRARVLDPATSPAVSGWDTADTPRPAVYRSSSLLVPGNLLGSEEFEPVRRALTEMHVELVDSRTERARYEDETTLPRSVALRASATASEAVVIDAWRVLQNLRARTGEDDGSLVRSTVEKIGLEHLWFSSPTITGAPHEGSAGPFDSGYSWWEAGRRPVAVVAEPPERDPTLSRRPVIAVLDTGIAPHPWFDGDRDGFLSVWKDLEEEIKQIGLAEGRTPAGRIDGSLDTPITETPLTGLINKNVGHSTFIQGIIRQAAPQANVLAVRVMHSDGVAYESDVLLALWRIAEQVRADHVARHDPTVDIVSLSLGTYAESNNIAALTMLREVLDELADLGVLIVAAAGNDATSRKFWPAAYDTRTPNGRPQVLSVGALNPNGTKAIYANQGPWVRYWATGSAVVSTYPNTVRGPREPVVAVRSLNRSDEDPDDYGSGFASWSGSSFATPLVAAELANALLKARRCEGRLEVCADTVGEPALKETGRDAAVDRAQAAFDSVTNKAIEAGIAALANGSRSTPVTG